MSIAVILVMWPGPFDQLSSPLPKEAPHEIWLQSARWFSEEKMFEHTHTHTHTHTRTTEVYLSYKLTIEPNGSGELKNNNKKKKKKKNTLVPGVTDIKEDWTGFFKVASHGDKM